MALQIEAMLVSCTDKCGSVTFEQRRRLQKCAIIRADELNLEVRFVVENKFAEAVEVVVGPLHVARRRRAQTTEALDVTGGSVDDCGMRNTILSVTGSKSERVETRTIPWRLRVVQTSRIHGPVRNWGDLLHVVNVP